MDTRYQNQIDPVSSGEMPIVDPDRLVDIEQKHRRVAEFLELHGYDALLLTKPGNFSWFTSGGNCARSGSHEPTAALFITPEARVVVTDSANSARLFDRELPGLGFQLKERAWYEPRHLLVQDLCRSRKVAADIETRGVEDISLHLRGMRLPLSLVECERLRELGRDVAHAVEATARSFSRGQTEAEVAGELAHRLIKHRIVPERLQVFADLQALRYPHWSYGTDRVERSCVIAAMGSRQGLHAGAARSICFGKAPDDVTDAHHRATLVQAAGMYFCRSDWELFEIWDRIVRIYEKYGEPDAWLRAEQAEIVGYDACEVPIVPKSEFRLETRMPVYWHPSVGPAITGDTMLVSEDEFELLTPMSDWPKLRIEIKGTSVDRPAILCRD